MAATIVSFCYLYADANVLVDDILSNWKSKAIIDVQSFSYECPNGYEQAYNYVWPGTTSGCWCGDVSYYNKNYYEIKSDLSIGYCDYNQTRAGCDDIRPTSSQPLNIWTTINSNATTLCIKRSNETWAQVAAQSGETCPDGMTKCGISANNTFCTQSSQCPINDIEMINLTLPQDSDALSQCNTTKNCTIFSQDSTSALIIKYQRGDQFDALPTSQFRLNEYSMCYDANQDDTSPNRGSYGLLRRSKQDCGQQGASLWNGTIFSISEDKLFDMNGLTGAIKYLNNFGYYRKGYSGANYQYHLFSRSYIPWSIHCRSEMSTLSDMSSNFSKLKTIQLILMIFTIIISLILGIALPILLLSSRSSSGEFFRGEVNCGKLVHAICKLIQVPLQIFGFLVVSDQVLFYRTIITKDCSTSEIVNVLASAGKDVSLTYYANGVNIILSGILLFMSLVLFIWIKVKDHKERMAELNQFNQSQPKQNDFENYSLGPKIDEEKDLIMPFIHTQCLTDETQAAVKSVYTPYDENLYR